MRVHSAERGTAVQLTPLPPRHPQMTEGGTADGLGTDTLKQALLTLFSDFPALTLGLAQVRGAFKLGSL